MVDRGCGTLRLYDQLCELHHTEREVVVIVLLRIFGKIGGLLCRRGAKPISKLTQPSSVSVSCPTAVFDRQVGYCLN